MIGAAFLARHGGTLAIGAAIVAAAVWIDHRGYERAEAHANTERLERIVATTFQVLEIDRQLKAGLEELERGTADKLATIQQRDRTIVQPIIQAELARDPALAARECLSPELVRAINISRGHSGGTGQADALGASPPRVSGATGAR